MSENVNLDKSPHVVIYPQMGHLIVPSICGPCMQRAQKVWKQESRQGSW